MRLIDADALMEAFRTYMAENHDRERCVSEENCNACDRGCLWRKIVVKAPTIDPESLRKQGKWIRGELQNGERRHKCSVCREACRVPTVVGKPVYDYCPNCGAKMKGAGEDADS